MPVTVRGTDILFNDSTTQTTGAPTFPTSVSAGTVQCAERQSTANSSTSFVTVDVAYMLRGGIIRTRIRAAGGSSDLGNGQGNAQLFINGVGVGSEVASNSLLFGSVLQQDVSVNAGDTVQVGYRRTGGTSDAQGYAQCIIGVSSVAQTTVVASNIASFAF